jgi:DNA-binding SARP family transcriptional activator
VLALLVLHANEVVRTERLVDEIWRERRPANASAALQNHISRLRKDLGAEVLVTKPWGYVLRTDPGGIDLCRFERLIAEARPLAARDRRRLLAEALALWRGPALADLAEEPALAVDRARLDELRLAAIEQRVDADLEVGANHGLIAELEALVAAHPLRERMRGQLILALYRAGRQADALETYRETRRVLVEELGIEPSSELRELERAILRQDPALAARPRAVEETLRSILAVPGSAAAATVLLPLGEALAGGPVRRELVLARIVPPDELTEATAALQAARETLSGRGAAVRVAAFSSSAPGDDIVRLAGQFDVDLVILSSDGDPLSGPLAAVFDGSTSDVAALVERGGPLRDGPIVVPFGAFEHDWAALELGAWAAAALGRPLRLVGATDGQAAGRDASRLLADASLIVQHTAGVLAEPLLGRPGREGVSALAEGAGLLVLGLSDRWRAEGLGETRAALVASPPAPTVLVRRGLRPSGIAPPATLTRFTWSIERSRI